MDNFIHWVQWLIIIESLFVIAIIVVIYLLKAYYFTRPKSNHKKNQAINGFLQTAIKKNILLSKSQLNLLRRFDFDLAMLGQLNLSLSLKTQLIQQVLLPKARRYTQNKDLVKRFLATEYFRFSMEKEDKILLVKLIHDGVLLVSLNAIQTAFKNGSPFLINSVIDHVGKKGRFYQSINLAFLAESSPSISNIIIERIQRETDPQINAFCFQLLAHLPANEHALILAQELLINTTNLELKLNILNYLAHIQKPAAVEIIRRYLHDDNWVLRTRAVQLLGELKDKASIQTIAILLRDREWWVRHRAAEALGNLGENGIMVLKNQNPRIDQYAFDAANRVLRSIEIKMEK